ncbi:MAG: hypothetical protein ACXWRA_03900 [Pseudobdellovibrionaceae bacterium]
MKNSLLCTLVLTFEFMVCSPSFAAINEKLQQYFRNELQTLNQSIPETPSESSGIVANTSDEAWQFSSFMLRIRPKLGFDIPELASLYVIPEAELVWQQSMPQGWAPYKPSALK